jgi:hypothetical protein
MKGNRMSKRTARKIPAAPPKADGAPGKLAWTTPTLTPIDPDSPKYALVRALLEKERAAGRGR